MGVADDVSRSYVARKMRITGWQPSARLLVLTMLAGTISAAACRPRQAARDAPSMQSMRIPLNVTEVEPGHCLVEVAVLLSDGEMPFVLDTGAPTTTLVANDRTAHYAAVRSSEARGVANGAAPCDGIAIDRLELGGYRLEQFPALRCKKNKVARNLLGLDAIGQTQFRIDLRRRELLVNVRSDPTAAPRFLKRLRGGHIAIPTRLGDDELYGLFDTGADTTVIDSKFVATHASSFVKKRFEEGSDANGTAIASEVYTLTSIRMGDLELHDVEVAAIPFSEPMRRDMGSETPVIVGTNVIAAGIWTLDLREGRWNVTPY